MCLASKQALWYFDGAGLDSLWCLVPQTEVQSIDQLAQGSAAGSVHWTETYVGWGDGVELRCGGELISLNWGRCRWWAPIRSAPAVGKWHPILTGSRLWADPHGLIPPQRAVHSPALYLRDTLTSLAYGRFCYLLLVYCLPRNVCKLNLFLFLQCVSQFLFLSVFYVHVIFYVHMSLTRSLVVLSILCWPFYQKQRNVAWQRSSQI